MGWPSFLPLAICLSLGAQNLNSAWGADSTGRVSAMIAEGENPHAASYNPAVLAAQQSSHFSFSTGSMGASFAPMENVIVDSPKFRTRDSTLRKGAFEPSPVHSSLWSLGLTHPFTLAPFLERKGGIGVALSGPYGKVQTFRAPTPYDFTVLRYGNASQFKATIGSSFELWPNALYIGGGLMFSIASSGYTDAFVVTDNPTGRMAVDVGWQSSGIVGLYGKWFNEHLGLVVRDEVNPLFEQKFEGQVEVERGTSTLTIPIHMKSSLYYEPLKVELEWQHRFSRLIASLGIGYERWSKYHPPHLVVETVDADRRRRSTLVPDTPMRDTWNPRLSITIPLGERWSVCSGYAYRPSPVLDLSGMGNLLDSDTHVTGLAISHTITKSPWLPLAITLSLAGQYHFITSRTVEKANPSFVGAPGYIFSGTSYTYNLALGVQL